MLHGECFFDLTCFQQTQSCSCFSFLICSVSFCAGWSSVAVLVAVLSAVSGHRSERFGASGPTLAQHYFQEARAADSQSIRGQMPPGARLDDSDDDDESEHSDDDNGRAHSAARRRAARSLDRARERPVDDDERRERQHARNESEHRDRVDRRDRGRDRDRRRDRVRHVEC